ncbi:MAG: NfeD family protein [Chromatiales bacterium]|nr:NfeD family protein [Chromatiales bacterium]
MDWANSVEFWHWWVFAVVLIVVEILSPAAFFLWLGIAAGLVGGILLAFPELSWEAQLGAFAVLSVISVFAGRAWFRHNPIATDQPTLNRRGEQYVGRVFALSEPIVNGVGKIRVDDTTWKVNGTDCPSGSRVRVTGVNGVVLLVECGDSSEAPTPAG